MNKKAKLWLMLLVSPIIIITMACAAFYLPCVQQWAVTIASESASKTLGMEVSVGRVQLTFPFNLCIEEVKAVKRNDSLPQCKDTVIYVKRAVSDIRLIPLLNARIESDVMELIGLRLNTIDIIPQARIKGTIGRLALTDGLPVALVNMKDYFIDVDKLVMDNMHLDIALTNSVSEDTSTTQNMWKISVGEFQINNSDVMLHTVKDSMHVLISTKRIACLDGKFDLNKGLYNLSEFSILNGCIRYDNTFIPHSNDNCLDLNHIFLEKLNTKIKSLHYSKECISLKIKEMSFEEKCGFKLESLASDIALDSTYIRLGGVMKTPLSTLMTQMEMDLNALNYSEKENIKPGKVKIRIDASLNKKDISKFLGGFSNDFNMMLPDKPITLNGEAEGNLQDISIKFLKIEMPTMFALETNGSVKGFMELTRNPHSNNFSSSIHTDIITHDMSRIEKNVAPSINIPSMRASLDINAKGVDYDIILKAFEHTGSLKANAKINIKNKKYDATLKTEGLNIGRFMKDGQLGLLNCEASFSGQGTDMLSEKTWTSFKAKIDKLDVAGYNLNNINGNLLLEKGRAKAKVEAHNKLVDGEIDLDALIDKKGVDATLMTELAYIDLYNLKFVDNPLKLSVCTHIDMHSDFHDKYSMQGNLGDIVIRDSVNTYQPNDITMDVRTDIDTTIAKVYCGDFLLDIHAEGGYKHLIETSEKLADIMNDHFKKRTINQQQLRSTLPRINMRLHSSKDNPIYRFIKYYDVDYDEIDAEINTSYEKGIMADILLKGITTKGYKLDTIALKVNSSNAPYSITYQGYIHNVKPNAYVFNVLFGGEVLEHGISLNTVFRDAKNVKGLEVGVEAEMVENGLNFRIVPNSVILGYETFNLKENNYILLDRNNRVFADVSMLANNGTGIQLYSSNNEENSDNQQDITISVSNINLGRLFAAIPYAPKIEGLFNGDLHFVQELDDDFSISSSISTRNLIYEECPVGNLGTELVYIPKNDGSHNIDGILSLDDREIGKIKGAYDFNTSQIDADMTFERFPMQICNGFVPDKIIGVEGYADGKLSIHGTSNTPHVNGELYLESASLISIPYGIKMRFDNDPIRIVDSKLLFENFQMYANNNKPLTTYGSLDFSDTSHMNLDLLMRSENFLLIDSKETRRSEAYGKAYVNFFGSIKGEFEKLKVRGKVDVLPTSNIYYILKDSPLSNDNRMKDLVTFTNLTDSGMVEITRPIVDGLDVNLNITVQNGSHVKCWLNDSKTNYLDIIGEGDLRLKYVNDLMGITGRYTISEGEIKYSLPIIPLKTFVISSGSYIEFNGDMMNPKLNITAKETKKASVSIDGTNRMVTFNTGVVLTKTLNDMGLEFTIEAPEDNNINDDLSMMSKEERGKVAVTMLTTGMYLSDGNTSTFSMNSALNSFLQSEISSIAGSALKTLDLSFGMDNSTEEDGTIHTNYSFKFAKRFWNNRLSVAVGGKISTGPDVSGQNKSFFDNVEVQYRLSDVSNKYMRLFYNRSIYDFLEGYVGQYGAGFLWKKKVQNLKEIFLPSKVVMPYDDSSKKDTLHIHHINR